MYKQRYRIIRCRLFDIWDVQHCLSAVNRGWSFVGCILMKLNHEDDIYNIIISSIYCIAKCKKFSQRYSYANLLHSSSNALKVY